jgi:hypothetical protein
MIKPRARIVDGKWWVWYRSIDYVGVGWDLCMAYFDWKSHLYAINHPARFRL